MKDRKDLIFQRGQFVVIQTDNPDHWANGAIGCVINIRGTGTFPYEVGIQPKVGEEGVVCTVTVKQEQLRPFRPV